MDSRTVSGRPIEIQLSDDQAQSETKQQVSGALADLLGRAHAWSLKAKSGETTTLTFSSMLAAMVSGADPLCVWLRRHLALRGASLTSVSRGVVTDGVSLPSSQLVTTFSFRQALAEAQRLAGNTLLDVRHFMAAYAVIENYHVQDFRRLRIDRREWCLELAEKLQAAHPNERQQWLEYAQRAPAVLQARFDADVPRGEDLLGIGREVEAFAMLAAGRDTATPMSIGVFGAWGSGKSYFMAQLQTRVAELAASGPSSAYFQRIAQVRFNAWHYGETNIIASLVDQIFRNLRFDANDSDEVLRERKKDVLQQMTAAEESRQKAAADLEAAKVEEASRRADLERITREHEDDVRQKQDDLAAASSAIAATQDVLRESLTAHSEAIDAARRGSPAAEAADFVVKTMLQDPALRNLSDSLTHAREEARWVGLNQATILWGVVVLVLTTVAVRISGWLTETGFFTTAAGFVAAVTPIAAAWLKALRVLAERGSAFQVAVRDRTAATVAKIEAAAAEERQRLEEQLASQQQAAERLRAELQVLQQRAADAADSVAHGEARRRAANEALAAATAEVVLKKAQLESVTSGSLLEEMIMGLAAKDDYRKELGTLARARTDFEALSTRMTRARNEHDKDKKKPAPVLDRVVLYIDDLDRCPADKVREVLRAVHLLLAFDLFICVVAVDPRWVIQCLAESPGLGPKAKNPELEILGGVATPTDYLEKIFQIPLWLRPIPAGQRAPIAASLLGASIDAAADDGDGQTAVGGTTAHGATGAQSLTADVSQSPATQAPQYIQISPVELQFLEQISSLLDGNVRALKRFVNTYRLVKASLSDVELDYFVQEPGERAERLPELAELTHLNTAPYMLCLTLLAVLAAQRSRAEALVKFADATDDASRRLGDWLKDLAADKRPVVQAVATDLSRVLLPGLAAVEFKDFAVWLERTRRYSFYL